MSKPRKRRTTRKLRAPLFTSDVFPKLGSANAMAADMDVVIAATSAPFLNPTVSNSEAALAGAVTLSSNQVWNLLNAYLSDKLIRAEEFRFRTVVADTNYVTVPINFLRNMALTDPILAPQSYRADVFDCDDYVSYLRTRIVLYCATKGVAFPPAVGLILTQLHAFNFCFSPDGMMYLLNTQSEQRSFMGDPDQFSAFLNVTPDNIILSVYV